MASERAESIAPVRASKPYTASMLRPEPSGPQRHWAFALRPSARDEALQLADALSAVGAGPRTRTTKAFDRRAPPALRGDDYVAATEARLREIAADAAQAEREGLTLFSAVA